MPIIESIPNVSEGRRPEVIRRIADAHPRHAGRAAARRLVGRVAQPVGVHARRRRRRRSRPRRWRSSSRPSRAIDLRTHQGEHPRLGAVDVVPFVPIEGVTMEDCVALAKEVGAAVAERFGVPVYLYEEASANPAAQEPRGHPPRRVRRARGKDGGARSGRRTSDPRRRTRRPAPRSSARACRSSPTTST